jgi:hypothetical protein
MIGKYRKYVTKSGLVWTRLLVPTASTIVRGDPHVPNRPLKPGSISGGGVWR